MDIINVVFLILIGAGLTLIAYKIPLFALLSLAVELFTVGLLITSNAITYIVDTYSSTGLLSSYTEVSFSPQWFVLGIAFLIIVNVMVLVRKLQ